MVKATKVVRRATKGMKKGIEKKAPVAKTTAKKAFNIKYDDAIQLPERNVPPTDFLDFPTCIYGEKGIGKTSLAAQFPGAMVFMFERGRRNLPIFQIPRKGERPLDWARFKEYMDLIAEDDTVQTPVIDTIDRAYELCYEWVCGKFGVKSPEEAGKNKSGVWNAIREEAESCFNALIDIKGRVVFVSHARTQDIEQRLGAEAVTKVVPTASPMVWKYIQTCVDMVFYYGYRNGRRALAVRGHESMSASVGPTNCFLDPDGNPVNTIYIEGTTPKQRSPEYAFDQVLAGFDNQLYDVDTEDAKKKAAGAAKLKATKKKE